MTERRIEVEDLIGRLTIEADFSAWDYNDRLNRLKIDLYFDGVGIASTYAYIEPALPDDYS